MPTEITFYGWQRPLVGALVDAVEDGRPRVTTTLEMRGRDAAGEETGTETVPLTALLTGPADVAGLQSGAVVGRFPASGAVDAETTMCPYVDLRDSALPWRYTPRRTPVSTDRRLRPWLALLVGTDEEVEAGSDTASLAGSMLRAHPLSASPASAHVQEAGGRTLARLLSRRPLAPDTWYTAVLVPTFVVRDGELVDAWTSSQQSALTLPVYTQWRFRTGAGGDFRTLATRLKPGAADPTTGLAPLRYPRLEGAPELSVGGALTAVDGPDDALPDAIRDDLARLRTRETDQAGRPIVGLPIYGAAWHAEPDSAVWGATLNGDPRHRGVAGLGLRLAVELQEELAELVARQAGALEAAAERVRHLALGLAASAALWRRRLPSNAGRRIWLFGPALRRVMTASGPVDALATADDRPLPRGWFSTAARRTLRRGPPRSALAQRAASDPARFNPAANRTPPAAPFVEAGLPRFDDIGAPEFEPRRVAVARRTASPADRMLASTRETLNRPFRRPVPGGYSATSWTSCAS